MKSNIKEMKIYILHYMVIMLVVLSACKKDEPTVPEPMMAS